MKTSIAFFLALVLPSSALADIGNYFVQQVDAYFALHGTALPSNNSGNLVSGWSPSETFLVSNAVCHAVAVFEPGSATNSVPSSICVFDSATNILGKAMIKRFESQRDAWSSLASEIVWSSRYFIGSMDKYASTNLTTHCSVFFPLVRHDDEILGTDSRSATILIRNLRIDVSSDASLAREFALALADDVKEQDIFEE